MPRCPHRDKNPRRARSALASAGFWLVVHSRLETSPTAPATARSKLDHGGVAVLGHRAHYAMLLVLEPRPVRTGALIWLRSGPPRGRPPQGRSLINPRPRLLRDRGRGTRRFYHHPGPLYSTGSRNTRTHAGVSKPGLLARAGRLSRRAHKRRVGNAAAKQSPNRRSHGDIDL
jgi:hypothetical protein